MNPLTRFLRFNVVGAIGVVLQLAILALLNRALPHRYLLTSTLAVELTILHNFAWHTRYTWPQTTSRLTALLRFHLSNGLVSIFGNLVLMHLFVRSLHTPVLLANALSITCCGLINFLAAQHWVFANDNRTRLTARTSLTVSIALLLTISAHAQPGRLPNAPTSSHRDYGLDCAYENVFFGPAASLFKPTHLAGTAGITFGQYAAKPSRLSASPQFEIGVAGPLPAHPVDGFVSADYMFASKFPHHDVYPSLTAGYTRFFITGNAVNFGVGADLGTPSPVRIEIRDYWLLSQPEQHLLDLRIALGKLIAD